MREQHAAALANKAVKLAILAVDADAALAAACASAEAAWHGLSAQSGSSRRHELSTRA